MLSFCFIFLHIDLQIHLPTHKLCFLNCQCSKTCRSFYFCSYFIVSQNTMKLRETCQSHCWKWISETRLLPTDSFFLSQRKSLWFCFLLCNSFSTHWSSLWQVIEGKGEAMLGQAWKHAGDLRHGGIPALPTTIVVTDQEARRTQGRNNWRPFRVRHQSQ